MRYHNDGVLRTELDSTLRIRRGGQKLGWREYLPPFALCFLLAVLLMTGLLG